MAFNDSMSRAEVAALIPEEVARTIIQGVESKSVFLRLAKRLPNFGTGQLRVPVLSVLPSAFFVTPTDTGLKQTTQANWTGKNIVAEEIACIMPVAQSVFDDASYDLWEQLASPIEDAIGAVIDGAAFTGTNAPASWPTGIIPLAVAAGNSVAIGATPFTTIMGPTGVISLVEADGFMVNGHVGALTMKGTLRGLVNTQGTPIFMQSLQGAGQYSLDGSPIYFPTNNSINPANHLLISGDWNQAVYSWRQEITYKVLDQAVITDAGGLVTLNLPQQDMIALRVVARLGWQVANSATLANTNAATRFPFAVLTP